MYKGKNIYIYKYIKRASVKLWRVKVSHSTIRSQLKMLNYPEEGPGLSAEMPVFVRKRKMRSASRVTRK